MNAFNKMTFVIQSTPDLSPHPPSYLAINGITHEPYWHPRMVGHEVLTFETEEEALAQATGPKGPPARKDGGLAYVVVSTQPDPMAPNCLICGHPRGQHEGIECRDCMCGRPGQPEPVFPETSVWTADGRLKAKDPECIHCAHPQSNHGPDECWVCACGHGANAAPSYPPDDECPELPPLAARFLEHKDQDYGIGALPELVIKLVRRGALIVGSTATRLLDPNAPAPKDIDLMIPPAKWRDACRPIMDAKFAGDLTLEPTGFGGLRFTTEGIQVDVWPDTVDEALARYQKDGQPMPHILDLQHSRVYTARSVPRLKDEFRARYLAMGKRG